MYGRASEGAVLSDPLQYQPRTLNPARWTLAVPVYPWYKMDFENPIPIPLIKVKPFQKRYRAKYSKASSSGYQNITLNPRKPKPLNPKTLTLNP